MRCRRETFLARFRLTLKYAFFFPLLLPLRFNFLWPVFPHVIPVPFSDCGSPAPRLPSDPIRNPVLSQLLGAFSGLRVRALFSPLSCSPFSFPPPANDVPSPPPSAPSFF